MRHKSRTCADRHIIFIRLSLAKNNNNPVAFSKCPVLFKFSILYFSLYNDIIFICHSLHSLKGISRVYVVCCVFWIFNFSRLMRWSINTENYLNACSLKLNGPWTRKKKEQQCVCVTVWQLGASLFKFCYFFKCLYLTWEGK